VIFDDEDSCHMPPGQCGVDACLSWLRDLQREGAAPARLTGKADRTAQQASQFLAQVQAETGVIPVFAPAGAQSLKSLKQLVLIFRTDAYARVRDADCSG